MNLKIEEIKNLDQLEKLEQEWGELLGRCPHRTLFLTFEWMATWCRYFSEESDLRILIIRDDGHPVLIAPLMAYHGPAFRHLSWMRAEMVQSTSNYHSNRFDFIYETPRREYFDLLWKYLQDTSRWHLLRLYPVRNSSETLSRLRSLSDVKKIPLTVVESQTSPYISVDRSWDEYIAAISGEMRRKGRKAERERKKKNLGFEVLDGEVQKLEPTLEEIFAVADSAWAGDAGTAISSSPELRGFYRDLAHLANRRNWLFLSLLRFNGSLGAFAYNLRYEGRIYNLKVAFHPDFQKKNPGHSLAWLTLSYVFSKRGEIREFDFLGDDDPYKLKWTSKVRCHSKLTLYHQKSLFARLVYLFEKGVVEPGRRARKTLES